MLPLPFDQSRPRHRKQTLTEARIREILHDAHWGVLSTVSADGEPYGVPLGFAFDEQDNSLIFHTANQGVKISNLSRDDRVCFAIVGSAKLMTGKFNATYESVVIFGRMPRLTSRQETLAAAITYCRKFAPQVVAGMELSTAEEEINDMALMMEKSADYMAMYRLAPTHIGGKSRNVGK